MRVAGDQAGRVLVFDRNEWECFIRGARSGEFEDVAGRVSPDFIGFRHGNAG